jgi:serine/threonine protein kinase
MTVHEIRLDNGAWKYDDSQRLGPIGGFGAVFVGWDEESNEVAVKRLHVQAGHAAHRELSIASDLMRRDLDHIVPVLDAGQDAETDRYFLVMPICEGSLEDHLADPAADLGMVLAKEVTDAVILALLEVTDITHRDLKPGNILRHDGQWKLCDFGIAKFVEDATSIETLRGALTPEYAAPEQWRGERAGSATDVYALGCIIFRLVHGTTPFSGTFDDVARHHIESVPPSLDSVAPRISSFVSHMLRKRMMSRPSLTRCAEVLCNTEWEIQYSQQQPALLERAAQQVAEREAREESVREVERSKAEDRAALRAEAVEMGICIHAMGDMEDNPYTFSAPPLPKVLVRLFRLYHERHVFFKFAKRLGDYKLCALPLIFA